MDARNVKPNLVDALAQLEIGGLSRRRSFNKLPNELLRAILRRLQAHHLIRLRLVDNRWKVVIEDIWKDKKCLMIGQRWDKDYLSKLSAQMNGHLKLTTDFVFLQLKYNRPEDQIALPGHLCTRLPKLFPNIEQFYIIENVIYHSTKFISMLSQWSSTLSTLSLFALPNQSINKLYAQLNQMTKLKRLDLVYSIPIRYIKELAPTFERLEHFSTWNSDAINEIGPFFGEGFCSLGFHSVWVEIEHITNLPRFGGTLVRLSLTTFFPEVLSFICRHFTSLQMLRIDVGGCKFTTQMMASMARLTHLSELRIDAGIRGCEFTTDTIAHLARLTHLSELTIDGAEIELTTLDVAKLKPLLNIRTFSLVDFTFMNGGRWSLDYDVPQFSLTLSAILPNVVKLTVKSKSYPEIGNLFEANLNRFVHLRSFNVELDNSIVRLMN